MRHQPSTSLAPLTSPGGGSGNVDYVMMIMTGCDDDDDADGDVDDDSYYENDDDDVCNYEYNDADNDWF